MARPEPLHPQALADALRDLPRWQHEDGALVRVSRAATFGEAIAWVVQVAAVAEAMDHHPDIDIRYRTVTWHLRTHDIEPAPQALVTEPAVIKPAVTELDITLAHAIDAVVDAVDPGGPDPMSRA